MNKADTVAGTTDPQLAYPDVVTGGDVRVQREFNINDGEIRAVNAQESVSADYVLSYKTANLS